MLRWGSFSSDIILVDTLVLPLFIHFLFPLFFSSLSFLPSFLGVRNELIYGFSQLLFFSFPTLKLYIPRVPVQFDTVVTYVPVCSPAKGTIRLIIGTSTRTYDALAQW